MGERGFLKILDAAGTARLRVKLGTTSGRVTEVLIQLEIVSAAQDRP